MIISYGIRYDNQEYETGDTINHISYVWIDGEQTTEQLKGLSTIGISQDYNEETGKLYLTAPFNDEIEYKPSAKEITELAHKLDIYYRKHAYVVQGNFVEYGEDGDDLGDYNEWVLSNPKVICKLW